jgi:glycosyltransferase involved in cell wall biosynthesis
MSPTVSMVTPFFNTGEYLEQCLESVLAQTFEDFEYVLVDNHSTDQGAEIAADYAAKDERIRLTKPPRFLPQCDNFNYALRQISPASAYCKMVLADDWLYPQCLAEMVAVAEANPTIGLVSSYCLADTTVWGAGLPVDRSVFGGHEVARAHLLDGTFPYGNQSTVMYRADIVRRSPAFFTNRTVFFDTDAALRILATDDFGFIHQVLSYFRVHPESITTQTKGYKPEAADYLIALRTHGPTFLSAAELRKRVPAAENWVYDGLGRQWLHELVAARDDRYWDYQTRCLAAAGMSLETRRVWKGAVRTLALSLLGR